MVLNNLNDKLLNNFLKHITRLKGLSLNTASAYERDIIKFLAFIEVPLEEITTDCIIKFLKSQINKNLATTSINRRLMSLKAFFKFLKKEDILKIDPVSLIPRAKTWEVIPEILTETEIEKILYSPNIKTLKGARDRAILEILYSCGLRVSELVILKKLHINNGALIVTGKGNKQRIVPIGKSALNSLDLYLDMCKKKNLSSSPFLFSNGKIPLNRHTIWKIIKKYTTKSGITKNISPHTFRHSFATHLLNNGADIRIIQELLGHSNIQTTEKYTQICKNKVIDKFKFFHPRYK